MASSRACACACASRAPGAEGMKVMNKKLQPSRDEARHKKRFTGKLCSEGPDCCGMCSKLSPELRAVQPAHSQGLGMCWDCAKIARQKAVECSKNI